MQFDEIVEALNKYNQWLHYGTCKNRSRPESWRWNGKPHYYKRDPSRDYIPIKHGIRDYGRITRNDPDLEQWHRESDCSHLTGA